MEDMFGSIFGDIFTGEDNIFKDIEEFVIGVTSDNNKMLIKVMYQLLLSSTLLTEYLASKGFLQDDFNKFLEDNQERISKILDKQSEDMIKMYEEKEKKLYDKCTQTTAKRSGL